MPRIGLLLSLVAIPTARLAAQVPECASLLNAFRAKVEENYAGFRLEVRDARRDAYDAFVTALAGEAPAASGDRCFFVLDRYARWFDDPHLFVFQSPWLDSAETVRRARGVRVSTVTEREARAYLANPPRPLDPIEGIWYDGRGLRVAVVPDLERRDTLMAVVLTSDTTLWPVGAVRGTIVRQRDGTYRASLADRNFARRHLRPSIYKDVILRLSPGIWAKEYPAVPTRGLVDRADPRRATLVRHGAAVIVSVVSHDPAYGRVVDSLVAANDAALREASALIVDLRGNEGGSSWVTNALRPFIESREQHPTPFDGDSTVMLSTPDQIAYARRAFGPDTSAFVRDLVRRLETAPDEFVVLPDGGSAPRDTLFPGTDRVGIITDRGTVSAGEVLVLRALRSERAQVFGEPTAGALDYPSVNVVRVLPDEDRWFLGYPTMAASVHLPANGMRGKGIPPDVTITVDRLWGAIDEVLRRLERRE